MLVAGCIAGEAERLLGVASLWSTRLGGAPAGAPASGVGEPGAGQRARPGAPSPALPRARALLGPLADNPGYRPRSFFF